MKTGIVRRIDDLGRVVIPKEMRDRLQITEGDPLEISIENGKICFEKYIKAEDYELIAERLRKELLQDDNIDDKERNALDILISNVIKRLKKL